jgi:phospho-N-acetylmuramoyl-pentapeptide-transferase
MGASKMTLSIKLPIYFVGSFLVSVLIAPLIIKGLKRLKAGQSILEYVVQHESKAGTPTMGGIIFIIPTLLTTLFLLFTDKIEYSMNLMIVLFVFISYGIIGFIDDYLSIKRKTNKGLTQTQKLLFCL